MANLNSREEIRKVDKQNVLGSVEALPDQCLHAWEEASRVVVPESYRQVKNVVMCGMGGSGLGARVIESVYAQKLKVPFVRLNDYDLPGFVDQDSLVICSTYSGTTEETLENAKQAIAKKAKWLAIGSGGTLIDMAKDAGVPYYQINPQYNPSDQPRMAIGYSVVGQLVMASKTNLFRLTQEEIERAISTMKVVQQACLVEVPESENQAKQLAQRLKGKIIFYVAARHLIGAMHTVNNQLNENAKNISSDVTIPELNHHLMEGLKHPQANTDNLIMFFANSRLYPNRIQQRFAITQEVVRKNHIELYVHELKAKHPLDQAFELIQFGGFVNLYLSVLYGQNPAPIPWVDYFKKQLGQPLGR